jgi:hypothetical protein
MITIEFNTAMLEGFVRAWLKDTLETLEFNLKDSYVHPDDQKEYKKNIKAVKRLLDYVGHHE